MNQIKGKYLISIMGYTSWCGLGFIRGINSSKYQHSKCHHPDEPYLYLNLVVSGFFVMVGYANPLLLPITLYKELYRLEINVRKLEKGRKYYDFV